MIFEKCAHDHRYSKTEKKLRELEKHNLITIVGDFSIPLQISNGKTQL
jgi:hypothetical protein